MCGTPQAILSKIMQNRLLGSTWMQLSANWSYCKLPKISPGLIFFKGPFWGSYFWRGLSTEGKLRFKIDWAGLIVGRKFTIFAFFNFVFEGNFKAQAPRGGAYIWRAIQRRVFCVTSLGGLYMEGLIFGILRYSISTCHHHHYHHHYQGSLSWAEPMAYPVCLIFHHAKNSLVHEAPNPSSEYLLSCIINRCKDCLSQQTSWENARQEMLRL